MPLPAIVPLAITGASVLGGIINSLTGPRNPFTEEDIMRYLQLEQSRALAEDASATRRRLAAAGQGGSGVINAVISDQASRIRNQFEEQRQKMLLQLKQSQYEQGLQAQQNRAGLFGNIASLGMAAYQLSQPNPFQGYLDQLAQLQQGGQASTPLPEVRTALPTSPRGSTSAQALPSGLPYQTTLSEELQSLNNRSALQDMFINNPHRGSIFGPNVNMYNLPFQPYTYNQYGIGV